MPQPFSDQPSKPVDPSARSITIRPHALWGGVLRGGACFILCSPLLFSVNPLPLALICAADEQLVWMLAGTALGAWQWGGASVWTLAASTLAILLRLLLRLFYESDGDRIGDRLRRILRQSGEAVRALLRGERLPRHSQPIARPFDDSIARRILLSLLSALFCALALSLSGGFAFYDLYGSVLYLLLTPPLTAFFARFSPFEGRRSAAGNTPQIKGIGLLARAAVIGCICFCGRPIRLFGLSLVLVLAVWICLDATRRSGLGTGILWAIVCGCPYDLFTLPLLIGICLVYALLRDIIGAFSLLIATLGGAVYLLLFAKDTALWTLLPSLVVGVSLFSARCRLTDRSSDPKKTPAPTQNTQNTNRLEAQIAVAADNHAQTLRTISAISGAFSSLAETFRSTKPISHPTQQETMQLCEQVMKLHCNACPHQTNCHSREEIQHRTITRPIGKCLIERGQLTKSDDEALPFRKCSEGDVLIESINESYARACYNQSRHNPGELFSMNCNGIAHLLRDILHQERELAEEIQPSLTKQIATYLRDGNMTARQVIVYGADRLNVRISGLSPAMLTVSREQFQSDIGKILGAQVSKPSYNSEEEGVLTFHTLPTWQVRCRYRCEPASSTSLNRSRAPCGDTVRTFEDANGRFYALLCDGMGQGQNAAITSSSCAVFLERTLRAGVSVSTALALLNQYLLARAESPEQEISSTVDLFCFDRYTGQGELIKSGAAPSWLLRNEKAIPLLAQTLPIGILQTIDAQVLPIELQPNDQFFMMSDGVYEEDFNEAVEDRMERLLLENCSSNQETLLQAIFNHAKESCDDRSAIAIFISKNEPPK